MGKQIEHHETNIDARDNAIVAMSGAIVATQHAKVDRSYNVTISGEIAGFDSKKLGALMQLVKFVKDGGLKEEDAAVARFIVDDIEGELNKENVNSNKLMPYAKKLAALVDASKPIIETVIKAVEVLRA